MVKRIIIDLDDFTDWVKSQKRFSPDEALSAIHIIGYYMGWKKADRDRQLKDI